MKNKHSVSWQCTTKMQFEQEYQRLKKAGFDIHKRQPFRELRLIVYDTGQGSKLFDIIENYLG